jgi:hypothetical protein
MKKLWVLIVLIVIFVGPIFADSMFKYGRLLVNSEQRTMSFEETVLGFQLLEAEKPEGFGPVISSALVSTMIHVINEALDNERYIRTGDVFFIVMVGDDLSSYIAIVEVTSSNGSYRYQLFTTVGQH